MMFYTNLNLFSGILLVTSLFSFNNSNEMGRFSALVSGFCSDLNNHSLTDTTYDVSGTIIPEGPPTSPPSRIDAGTDCIVDLVQLYQITGSLTGKMKLDYRIIVHGPCGSPAGTYNEEWIAFGDFSGYQGEKSVTSRLSYTATVTHQGMVNGTITLGQGMSGTLTIRGQFNEGKLAYQGTIR